ncbi:MAG: hypothetical protein CMK83_16755 [Pseudomonadales bacterium]|jgi:hypothetical protein|uniref:CocE/NonD family hydrolase n=1 Tax=unclassified Ketobacter TaxID=2639109 RepID=UPI000C4C18D7|nr:MULTISPECIES: CocE/NonD family hydrolase [unclassified Ketobacter]MAQ25856.1 hypothetical protein [Pseudomonadales bacterium]MEC8810923.1 CocE/NonD family hydrolase [Pseudomonadota bacterium]HAG96909.1 hypothetical protein [Gammaproteobacteria bacterium]MBI28041.1 hypothetical protein [Pseudomonadales bacterium]RLT88964.1 MAG: hypothetical protein D9N13_17585 [Ketobacter sp. GenoA1]|tara:strand:+ start:12152 stop:13987 length:1836 start_codon:yes stop_codon:yes gene_type:complete
MKLQYLKVVIATLLYLLMQTPAAAAERISPNNLWVYDDDITIPTLLNPSDPASDTIYLPANIFVPTSDDPNQRFPAVIFISSWALNEYEYIPQAQILADKGYVVLSYTTRGFYNSPGAITTAGIEDFSDGSAAIDYLLDSRNGYPVDPDAIGLAGISYGAGISLLTGFNDERVKAIVAMSGWVDLIDSLWAGNTPNYAWIELLIFSSQPIPLLASNNPSPEIETNYANMKVHENVAATKEWGYVRSAASYLDMVNARENPPAIYMANNLHDYLFQPDSLFTTLKQYNGDWRLDLSRGVHGSGEASGLLGNEENTVWENLGLWFDHYLKGIDNGINTAKPFSTKVLNTAKRESYDSLSPEDEIKIFNLIPESGAQGGQLSETYANTVDLEVSFSTLDRITYPGWITGALSATGRTLNFNEIDRSLGLVFTTPILDAPLRLRGEAKVNLAIVGEDKAQYFGYLFYLNPNTGIANWIGHAPFSCHQSEGCVVNDGDLVQIVLDFYWTAVDIPAGSQLMLVIDGNDPDYWRYETTPETNTVVFQSNQAAYLELPVVWENTQYDDPVANFEQAQDLARGANGDDSSFSGSGAGGSVPFMLLLAGLGYVATRKHFSS